MNPEDVLSEISQSQYDKCQRDSTYMTCSVVKFRETENRMEVARDWRGEEGSGGIISSIGTAFQFCKTKRIR